jgi:hypothetical protein
MAVPALSTSQSALASGSLLFVGTFTGAAGCTGLSLSAATATCPQIAQLSSSGAIPLLGTYNDVNGDATPCLSAAQLQKLVVVPTNTAASAAAGVVLPTASANGDQVNQLFKGVFVAGTWKVLMWA